MFVTYSKSDARIQYLCGTMTESQTLLSTPQWLAVVEKFICIVSSNNRKKQGMYTMYNAE